MWSQLPWINFIKQRQIAGLLLPPQIFFIKFDKLPAHLIWTNSQNVSQKSNYFYGSFDTWKLISFYFNFHLSTACNTCQFSISQPFGSLGFFSKYFLLWLQWRWGIFTDSFDIQGSCFTIQFLLTPLLSSQTFNQTSSINSLWTKILINSTAHPQCK